MPLATLSLILILIPSTLILHLIEVSTPSIPIQDLVVEVVPDRTIVGSYGTVLMDLQVVPHVLSGEEFSNGSSNNASIPLKTINKKVVKPKKGLPLITILSFEWVNGEVGAYRSNYTNMERFKLFNHAYHFCHFDDTKDIPFNTCFCQNGNGPNLELFS
ncbi:hypothetical protein VNO78_18657 [Psophocarpus tetragonolobus]|uniref:Uncharacterized protein n=1 Tax=Psophocarpus tetragonolobus TaxID=3891 RepID=A0AAN9XLQ9_PSOTE